MIKAHFIDNENDRIISKRDVGFVPRVGDELRFNVGIFYTVMLVVFVYDEGLERVNIGCDLCK